MMESTYLTVTMILKKIVILLRIGIGACRNPWVLGPLMTPPSRVTPIRWGRT